MKEIYQNLNIIGSDETGVGDYLTPLVAAAVFVPAANVRKLEALGITDSKKLTDKKIVELFEKIKPMIKSSVRKMSQKQYNFLTSNKKYNANELKMLLHMQALQAVESRVEKTDLIIIDQFSNESSINKYMQRMYKEESIPQIKTKIKLVEKGEMEHVSVAAASIVARANFIELMKAQEETWKMTFPLGTNDRVVEVAQQFVNKHGKDNLYNVAKLSFKTTSKIT